MTRFRSRDGKWALLAITVFAVASLLAAGCAADDSSTTAAAEADDHDDDEADHNAEADDHDDEADHNAVEVDQVIAVEMSEFSFSPDPFEVQAGSTVRFEFTNVGVVEHEAVIGDLHAQDEAETAMAEMADGSDHNEGAHGEGASIVLGPGESGELVVTFDEAGELIIGCHVPGHWEAGMRAALVAA